MSLKRLSKKEDVISYCDYLRDTLCSSLENKEPIIIVSKDDLDWKFPDDADSHISPVRKGSVYTIGIGRSAKNMQLQEDSRILGIRAEIAGMERKLVELKESLR